jgi:hypothetical protein
MSNWLDLSNNANCFESMYVKGFVDISGGSLQLRNSDNHLLVGGDASFNGGVYLGRTKLFTTDVVESITFTGTINQLGQDIDGEASQDYSGISVSLSSDGTIVAIGAHYNDGTSTNTSWNSGHVRIYQYNGTVWNQLGQDIDGEAEGDRLGWAVSLSSDGTIVAIGAHYNDGTTTSNAGHVRVYQYNGTVWNQLGQDIDGEAANDYSGYSVSINSDGTIVAIGAYRNDGIGGDSGHVRIHQYNSDNNLWNQLGQDIDGEANNDRSGNSVSINSDGTIVAIGAFYNDGTTTSNAGHVRIYQYNSSGNIWNQLGQDIDGEAQFDYSGTSVSLNGDGTIVAIGANENDGTTTSNAGHTRVYQYDSGNNLWNQLGQDIDGEASLDNSGEYVSLSSDGTIVAIGARDNGGNGIASGHVRIYQYNGTVWNQLGQDIDGESGFSYSSEGISISDDGTIVAIGAPYNNGTGVIYMGHVRVYELAHTKTYVQVPKQLPLQIGTETQRLGYAADISGIVDISGALFTQGDASMNGNLYVSGDATIGGALTFGSASIAASNVSFTSDISMNDRLFVNVSDVNYNGISGYLTTKTLSGGPSYQIGQDIDGEAANDRSGNSVSINSDGTIVAIGAYWNDGTGVSDMGHVRIYQYNGTVWNQLGQDIDGEASGDSSGTSVSINSDGTIVAIGAPYNDGTSTSNAGHVRIYQYNGTVWNQLGQDIDGEAQNDLLGQSVSLNE